MFGQPKFAMTHPVLLLKGPRDHVSRLRTEEFPGLRVLAVQLRVWAFSMVDLFETYFGSTALVRTCKDCVRHFFPQEGWMGPMKVAIRTPEGFLVLVPPKSVKTADNHEICFFTSGLAVRVYLTVT